MRLLKKNLKIFLSIVPLIGCESSIHRTIENIQSESLQLGSLSTCEEYKGLPEGWLEKPNAGMVWIPKGEFRLGSNHGYADEINLGKEKRESGGFWMDQTEVTVAQFSDFISATGYITDAEIQNQAAVFSPNVKNPQSWWELKSGYTWKTPNGKNGPPAKRNEPVRYVTKNDAEHYVIWLNHDLPTEVEWEYAAKANQVDDTPLHNPPKNNNDQPIANYWQGSFPFQNTKEDHFEGIAPVGCFTPNAFNLYDTIGNVWELTSSPYKGAHDMHMGNYQSLRNQKISGISFVIKGGSFLCADNYCARFRNSSRYPQESDLAVTHVGFRTIMRNVNR